VKEHTVRRIINSTYISLDGVIQNPQDWPGNGIESDGTSFKEQTDLLFRPSVTAQFELAGTPGAEHRHRRSHLPNPRQRLTKPGHRRTS
jgi:hypothetical protein